MKVRVVVELNVEFDSDGAELDYDQLRGIATECLRTHVDIAMDDHSELGPLLDSISAEISELTDIDVSEITYEVKEI